MAISESGARRREMLAGVSIGLAVATVLALASTSAFSKAFDLRLLDLKFQLRGERRAADGIALIGVDDATIRGYGRWPLPRDAYALLLTALEAGGVRAIGIDLQFPEDRNQLPESNALLAQVTGSNANIVHAAWFHTESASGGAGAPDTSNVLFAAHGVPSKDEGLAEAASVSLPYPELVESSQHFGHVSVPVDVDGAIRRTPLVVRLDGRIYPALPLALFGAARSRITGPSVRVQGDQSAIQWEGDPPIHAQIDEEGATWIDYAGDQRAFRQIYSMLDVLRWYRDGDINRLRATFKGRTVLLGLTSRQEASEDVGATPFSVATPLLYVHANVLDDLTRGRFLSRPRWAAYLLGLAIVGGLMGGILSRMSIPMGAFAAAVATVGLALGIQAALALGAMDIPTVTSLALVPLVYAGTGSYRYLFLQRRTQVREAEIRQGLSVQQRFLPEALIGKRLSRYLIESRLGAGGMGVVYRASDRQTGRPVALKVLTMAGLADEKARRRFRHEALALSRLRHANIAGLLEYDSQDGVDFIAMEFVSGASLQERLLKAPLTVTEAVDVVEQVAQALAEAHARGIFHRDLKPANVMIADDGQVKLLDFGVARLGYGGATIATLTGDLTETGQIVGTLAYMAPEVLHGRPPDARTDIYGIGMLLYEALTRRRPFPDDSPHEVMYMILHQPPPRPSILNGKINPALDELILRCLEKEPGARPEHVATVLGMLRPRP